MIHQVNQKVAESSGEKQAKTASHVQYDPHLLRLLAALQDDLKKSYDDLVVAYDDNQLLQVRPLYLEFKDTLRVYLSITSIHLYVYLRLSDRLDYSKKRIIAVNEQEAKEAAMAITRFISKYSSPSAVYDGHFKNGLDSLWTIVNWRAYKERMELYPLYYSTRY